MKHYVIIKATDPAAVPELVSKAKEIFPKTMSVPGVHSVEVHRSCSEIPSRFDLMIKIDMEPEALAAYDVSEPHQEWKKICDPLLASKAIFDCD